MNRHVNPKALQVAAEPAGQILWEALRGRRLGGFTFRKQVLVGAHLADFICHERAVVILLEQGFGPSRAGRARDEFLMTEGYSVFRVCAANVLVDMGGVCGALLAVLEGRIEEFAATTPPLPLRKNWGRSSHDTLLSTR